MTRAFLLSLLMFSCFSAALRGQTFSPDSLLQKLEYLNGQPYAVLHPVYIQLADYYLDWYRRDEANALLREANTQALKSNDPVFIADLRIVEGHMANLYDEYKKAKALLAQADSLLPALPIGFSRLKCLYHQIETEYNLGNLNAALSLARHGLRLIELDDHKSLKARFHSIAGEILVSRGAFPRALEEYLAALRILEKEHSAQQLAYCYNSIGWLYFKQYNDAECIAFTQKALELGKTIGDKVCQAESYSILGSCYSFQNKYQEGIGFYEKSLRIRREIGSKSGIAESLYNLGSVHERMNNIDLALSYISQSLRMDEALNNDFNLALSNKKMAGLLIKQGKLNQAEACLIKAEAYAQVTASNELIRDVSLLWAEFHERKGNWKLAVMALHRAIPANDSMYSDLSFEKAAAVRGVFDLETMENEGKKREQQLTIQTLEIENQRKRNVLNLIILILVSVLLIFGFVYDTKMHKQNRKLKQEIADRKLLEAQLIESKLRWEKAVEGSRDGLWDHDLKTNMVYYSPRWEEMFGFVPGEAPQLLDTYLELVHPEDLDLVNREIKRYFDKETPYFQCEYRMFNRSGELMWTLHRGSAIFDQKGNPIRLIGTTVDLTERKNREIEDANRHAEILRHQQVLLELSSLPVKEPFQNKIKKILQRTAETINCERASIWMVNDKFTSLRAQYLYQKSSESFLPEMIIYEKDHPKYFQRIRENAYIVADDARQLAPTSEFTDHYLVPLGITSMMDIPIRIGEHIIGVLCHEHVGPIRSWSDNEQVFGRTVSNIISLAIESEERLKVEQSLLKSQFNFEEAQSTAHVGNWEYNLLTGDLIWSKETYAIFELEEQPSDMLYAAYRKRLRPEDLAKLDVLVQNAVEKGEKYELEQKLVFEDGRVKYVNCIGQPILDENGRTIGLRGTDQDITLQKQAVLAKSDFLSVMSHEIRTPLNGVIGIANLLMEESLNDTQKEYIKTLSFSAQHLSNLVSDILDFSKIESNNLQLEQAPFYLNEVCHNVFKLFRNAATDKGIQYTMHADRSCDHVLLGDYTRLSQILSNLLSNAVKFTDKGSVDFYYKVLKTDESRATVRFIVKDTGIGIAEDQIVRIFDNFSQADKSITRQYGGTGLGLTISKKLVELQHGSIDVKSTLGEGAVFTVEIPFDIQQAARQADETPELPALIAEELPGMNVLVAEDNRINAMVLMRFLAKWGINATLVKDGQEALEILPESRFDLVLMDIQMPNMDGPTALKHMRKSGDEKLKTLPVIAFTADASADSHREFIENGFDACVTKPFNPVALLTLLKKYHKPALLKGLAH